MGDQPDFIPDDQFVPDSPAPAVANGAVQSPDFIADKDFVPDSSSSAPKDVGPLGTLGGAAEDVLKGGITETGLNLAERGLTNLGVPGLTPEDQAARQASVNMSPGLETVSKGLGFGLSALTGVGEAKALGALGEGALKIAGIGGLAAEAPLATRLAAGALKAGTEVGAMQADNEVSKAVDGTSGGVGDAITNVGLAAALGASGAPFFHAAGAASKGLFDAIGLKEFADRMAYRGANPDPNEMIQKEFSDAYDSYKSMGSEISGATGVKSAALENVLPPVNDKIISQAEQLSGQINASADRLEARGDSSGMVSDLRGEAQKIASAIDPKTDLITMQPQKQLNSKEIFDAINSAKQQLGEWGKFDKDMVPLSEVAFRNTSKNLGYGLKTSLEDPAVWGDAGRLQQNINAAWTEAIPAVSDVEKKFMTKIGGQRVLDPAKFASYMNTGAKSTSVAARKTMMENFVNAMDTFQKATEDAYEKAGLESPHTPIGTGALKESYGKRSVGAALADKIYDSIGPFSAGNAAGMAIGNAIAPGAMGTYAGRWALGPAFGAILKPITERVSNLSAFQGGMGFLKNVASGQNAATKAIGNMLVQGTKVVPQNLVPEVKHLLKLDETLKKYQNNQAALLNTTGNLDHYLPNSAQALAKNNMTAVNYLNSKRPSDQRLGILDPPVPPSKAQEAAYMRTLSIAEQPLMILEHAKNGTILPSDLQTVQTLYPEYMDQVRGKLMAAISDHVHDGDTIPYRSRQGMSLLLGVPLDSTMTPQAIMSIQGIYAQNQPQQPSPAPKKTMAALSKASSNLQTPSQSREARTNRA